jgi:hypothetical protein
MVPSTAVAGRAKGQDGISTLPLFQVFVFLLLRACLFSQTRRGVPRAGGLGWRKRGNERRGIVRKKVISSILPRAWFNLLANPPLAALSW